MQGASPGVNPATKQTFSLLATGRRKHDKTRSTSMMNSTSMMSGPKFATPAPAHLRTLTGAESASLPPIAHMPDYPNDTLPAATSNELSIGQFMRAQRHQRYSFSN